ncbi:MAG: helix-turn-helix domain-containing protein [Cyclobacteriaceae bacterium]
MEVIVFEKEAYHRMHGELMSMFKRALKEAKEEAMANADPANDWLSTEDAKKLLGIRSKTKLQELRDIEAIRFTKHGRIIRYSKRSILEYLDRNVPTY